MLIGAFATLMTGVLTMFSVSFTRVLRAELGRIELVALEQRHRPPGLPQQLAGPQGRHITRQGRHPRPEQQQEASDTNVKIAQIR